ncbi:hypothetical protein [Streptomyces sp. NPDC059455]|uniref:hypothetical protein n=1 Tax=Streptomyces sp. NPDC059455 TaxID=3346837 RepID=UPI0036A1C98C
MYAYADLLRWPLFIGTELMRPGEVEAHFVHNPSTVVLTACDEFDAVSVPRIAATDALVRLDRKGKAVPCLLHGDTGTFLTARGTGPYASTLPNVQVKVGRDARIILPPTIGARWDTPPWHLTERAPLELPSARLLHSYLGEGLRFYGLGETGARP